MITEAWTDSKVPLLLTILPNNVSLYLNRHSLSYHPKRSFKEWITVWRKGWTRKKSCTEIMHRDNCPVDGGREWSLLSVSELTLWHPEHTHTTSTTSDRGGPATPSWRRLISRLRLVNACDDTRWHWFWRGDLDSEIIDEIRIKR